MSHIPVMLDECVNSLVQNINGCYIDGTIGVEDIALQS